MSGRRLRRPIYLEMRGRGACPGGSGRGYVVTGPACQYVLHVGTSGSR